MSIQKSTNKTAVQVIIDFINENGVFKKQNQFITKAFDDLLTEVSLLEKEQIENAFDEGMRNSVDYYIPYSSQEERIPECENYYKQTFKN